MHLAYVFVASFVVNLVDSIKLATTLATKVFWKRGSVDREIEPCTSPFGGSPHGDVLVMGLFDLFFLTHFPARCAGLSVAVPSGPGFVAKVKKALRSGMRGDVRTDFIPDRNRNLMSPLPPLSPAQRVVKIFFFLNR